MTEACVSEDITFAESRSDVRDNDGRLIGDWSGFCEGASIHELDELRNTISVGKCQCPSLVCILSAERVLPVSHIRILLRIHVLNGVAWKLLLLEFSPHEHLGAHKGHSAIFLVLFCALPQLGEQ